MKDGLIQIHEKKWNEGIHATTIHLDSNGIGLSKTNHIAKFILDEVRGERSA